MKLQILIIHFNNIFALEKTLFALMRHGIKPDQILVFDNGSNDIAQESLIRSMAEKGVRTQCLSINLGWGKAINHVLSSRNFEEESILGIFAHDAILEKIDYAEIQELFKNKYTAIASPQYPDPLVCRYSVGRSFSCESGLETGKVFAGQMTACFVRPKIILEVGFDEECFVYGCENEIFLTLKEKHYDVFNLENTIVRNPSTDSDRRFSIYAYTINSIYIAKKHHGWGGFLLRILLVFFSALRLLVSKNRRHAYLKINSIYFAIKNPGRGFRTFRAKHSASLST